jgi:hypothetical protein
MHDGWCGKLIPLAAGLKLATPGSYDVANPFAVTSVGWRNEERLRRSKNIQWLR